MSILPNPPLTPDQVELLKSDNIVSSGALGLSSLGITPTAVEAILPTYLDRFRRGGWYERPPSCSEPLYSGCSSDKVAPLSSCKDDIMAALSRLLLLVAALTFGGKAMAADLENTLYLDVPAGRVVIEMRPDLAPATVAQIKALVRQGFYDGIVFHRVIDGFMAQTGDPKGDGTGGSGHKLKAEFSNEKHVRGVVSMARASDPDSADSQFFIMFAPAPSLDGKYTIWGKVVSGMEYIDQIKKGDPARNGTVTNPDKIIKMQVAADAEKTRRNLSRRAGGGPSPLPAAAGPSLSPQAGGGMGSRAARG